MPGPPPVRGVREETAVCLRGKFRVNANGRRLDVWLIYRCEKCGHSAARAFHCRGLRGAAP
ncbi:DUF1062 domain-containing protein [Acutalibacter caecimuris]|uniref:DUF1062 domain-containing protein n=1 Tax=Acutalibacter caecimuris TaxID=3093657 RepID=UPI002AC8D7B3|nr:DUF1062 domain-containing protein [Acutalibacter sp. M00118]